MLTFSFKTPTTRTLIRFDDKRIEGMMDRADRRNLSRAGAFTRATARQSIRKRKKPSKPGKPPSSHIGTLRNLIFFAWDPWTHTMVVGPFRTPPSSAPRRRRTVMVDRKTGAEVLEKGGRVIRMIPKYAHKRRKRGARQRSGAEVRRIQQYYESRGSHQEYLRRLITVQPRPFMSAALAKEMPKFPQLWSDSIRVA